GALFSSPSGLKEGACLPSARRASKERPRAMASSPGAEAGRSARSALAPEVIGLAGPPRCPRTYAGDSAVKTIIEPFKIVAPLVYILAHSVDTSTPGEKWLRRLSGGVLRT